MAEPGENAWDVGLRCAAREEGSFSYRNATIIEHDGQCAGCLIGYVRLLHGLGPERLRRRLTGPGSFVKRGAATEARMEGKRPAALNTQ